jgi:NAD(P) transhydrogenase
MTLANYDLIVIGSGPAGEKGAAAAAYFGKKVALVEREPVLGGAATNTGTIPSKTLRESALFLSGFRQREFYGLHFHMKEQVTVRDFLARERLVKENERARVQENLKRHGITLYSGTAAFADPHTIAIRPERCPEFHIQGDVILVATGSYPYRPPEFPFYDPRIYDSDTILTLHEMPTSMLIVGGGVIGCEYACMFAALGVQVALLEKRDRLIGSLDGELAEALRQRMESLGVRMLMPDAVAAVQGQERVDVRLASGTQLTVQMVLASAGRCGHTESLGLDRVGIAVDARGRIPVNEHYQSQVPHVYAAGDVIGSPALASTAMDQARVAMYHAFNLHSRSQLAHILPYGIFTIPECSMAGQTEESLKAKKVPYLVGRASYAKNARGQIIGDTEGFLKLLFHAETMKLLGVHMIGEQATELIHVGLTALLLEAGADLFTQTCYNYPTLTEVYKYAAYDALGKQAERQRQRQGAGKT